MSTKDKIIKFIKNRKKVCISLADMQTRFNISRMPLARALSILEKEKIIKIKRNNKNNKNYTNTYTYIGG